MQQEDLMKTQVWGFGSPMSKRADRSHTLLHQLHGSGRILSLTKANPGNEDPVILGSDMHSHAICACVSTSGYPSSEMRFQKEMRHDVTIASRFLDTCNGKSTGLNIDDCELPNRKQKVTIPQS